MFSNSSKAGLKRGFNFESNRFQSSANVLSAANEDGMSEAGMAE